MEEGGVIIKHGKQDHTRFGIANGIAVTRQELDS